MVGGVSRVVIDGFSSPLWVGGTDSELDPVLFISGAFQTIRSWFPFAKHFAPTRKVVLADLPGMGEADLLPRDRGMDFLADAAAVVLDAAEVERAYVVSASYGTPIAYTLAQRYPQRVARLTLAGVMREIPPRLRRRTERSLELVAGGELGQFVDEAVDAMLCVDPAIPIENRELAERVLRRVELMGEPARARYIENTARLLDYASLDLANPPTAPTLVFTGEHDPYTAPARCHEVAAALPDALFTTINDADHLFHLQRFDTTLALIDAFAEGRDLSAIPHCAPPTRPGTPKAHDSGRSAIST